MPDYYTKGNNETTIALFNKRLLYKKRLQDAAAGNDKDHIVDFNLGEKFLYGRTNHRFVPIQVSSPNYLKSFPGKYLSTAIETGRAMNFVVDAFADLARQFEKCVTIGQISPNDPYLSSLKIYKAHENVNGRYLNYLDTYFGALKNQLSSQEYNMEDFDKFVMTFIDVGATTFKKYPFTMPAYVKSRQCPINCSGLAIEIADLNHADDDTKIKTFLDSPNWNFYVNACNSYGFMIDSQAPWRLVADIDSDIMKEYEAVYGSKGASQVLSNQFKFVHVNYLDMFRSDLVALYRSVKKNKITSPKIINGQLTQQVITPRPFLSADFPEEYFLKKYFQMRFLEEESPFTEEEQQHLIKDCVQIASAKSRARAITDFEIILNKTFDYRGSISYIKKSREAREADDTRNPKEALKQLRLEDSLLRTKEKNER